MIVVIAVIGIFAAVLVLFMGVYLNVAKGYRGAVNTKAIYTVVQTVAGTITSVKDRIYTKERDSIRIFISTSKKKH